MTVSCWIYAGIASVGTVIVLGCVFAVLVYFETREPDPLRKRERVGL